MKWKRSKSNTNKLSFWKRIRFKYKLSFINENTLEEVWSFRLSQLSVFISLGVFAFSLVAFTAFIIIMKISVIIFPVIWMLKSARKSYKMLCVRTPWSG